MQQSFRELAVLSQDVDQAFQAFYDQLLEDEHFSIYFENDAQIRMLVQKQKENFLACLDMELDAIKENYVWLGEMHYDLRLPYVDFMKGMEILEDHFLLFVQSKPDSAELMSSIFTFFKVIKSNTARGYLNRMLVEDKKDLDVFFKDLRIQDKEVDNRIVMERMQWLKNLLEAVEHRKLDAITDFDSEDFTNWLRQLEFISLEKQKFLEDLDKRIVINTRNLFYFLQKEDYLEILPLYASLMNVYKLTMLLSSSVSFEMSDYIISNLRKDGLTNLLRKEAFEQFLTQEIATTRRYKSPFCLVFIDLDDFKGINDTYGHYSGDAVLQHVGRCIGENIRASDMGFRIGGDEFAIILKGAQAKQAHNVCKIITDEITKKRFDVTEKRGFSITVSCGIYECNREVAQKGDMKTLLEGVDAKLYEAKKAGKNRICY